jgi:hypothetical protein
MPVPITVIASDAAKREQIIGLIPPDSFTIDGCAPDALPDTMPRMFVIALPELQSPEEALIERLLADETTANIPIVIVSKLPMEQLQSVEYLSGNMSIAIVEEPVQPDILADTISFLLSS